jgi:hypothetical protein
MLIRVYSLSIINIFSSERGIPLIREQFNIPEKRRKFY